MASPLLFDLNAHPLAQPLAAALGAEPAALEQRQFPDGETYLRVPGEVAGRDCVILADLARPNAGFLPLVFLASTLREFGAAQVGLVAPYLCYMRQDIRF